jgi:uncharacterized protein (TIGR03083 family)
VADDEAVAAQLRAAHAAVFDGLLDATADLHADGWATATGCPGWDVHAQLSHTIGIERRMLGEPPPQIDVPDAPHLKHEVASVLEADILVRRALDGDQLRAEAREVFDRRLAALDATLPGGLRDELDSPFGRMRASRVLRLRVFDLVAHEQDVRRALGRVVEERGPHVDVAAEQLVRAWAALLPSRLGGHAGRLAVAIDGWGRAVLDLASGAIDREDGAEGHAGLSLTIAEAMAVGGGRSDAPDLTELQVGGDHDLLAAVLGAASVTP